MIRVALITVMLVAPSVPSVHADGTVFFRNEGGFPTPADRLVRDISGAPLVGTNYLAQLYYGTEGMSPSSLEPVTSAPARFRPSTHVRPGTWAGGDRTLPGFFPGQIAVLQVRVWDGTLAGTYEEAALLGFLGTQHGVSAPFTYPVPGLALPAEYWYMDNFRGFTLVPEPSIALFAMLGIGGLYFARTRRD